jgi:hypothetical protein
MKRPALFVLRCGLLGAGMLSFLLTVGCPNAAPVKPVKVLDIGIRGGRFDITIQNRGSPEAAGITVDVYINEEPPLGFKKQIVFPELGGTAVAYLDGFSKSDGTQFNPNHSVTTVWIGGNGYTFTRHGR